MSAEIESRLGRIEGQLDTYTRILMGILNRMEKRHDRIEEAIVTLRISNGKRTGMITTLSASLSAVVAVAVTYFKGA